jgi:hypothetical protein
MKRIGHPKPIFSEGEYRQFARDTKARGGLSKAEQAMAKRMAQCGSTPATIRCELGGRYSVEQIEKALS